MKNVTFLLQLSPLSPPSQPHPVLMKQYVTLYNATTALTSVFMTRGFIPVCEGGGKANRKVEIYIEPISFSSTFSPEFTARSTKEQQKM